MRKKKDKPRYNMWQNSGFMIGIAWKYEKQVLVMLVLQAIVYVGNSLTGLLVTPAILRAVERHVAIESLLVTIIIFVGLLILFSAARAYIEQNASWGHNSVRQKILGMTQNKAATTSYSNLEDERFLKLQARVKQAVSSNYDAVQKIWVTLTELLENVLGFIIYLMMMYNLEWYIMVVIVVSTMLGYGVSKRLNGYEYQHKEELDVHQTKIWGYKYMVEDVRVAKDVRIFGLRPWLEEVYEKAVRAFVAFYQRAARVYLLGNIVDLVLALVRNGIAYAYLIGLVLVHEISAAEFLLYFSAIEGFTAWITGILNNFTLLQRQALEIEAVREYLETPEPFKFDDGQSLVPEREKEYEIRLEDVTFCYPGAEKNTISHMNLTIKPGENLAVVGLNGEGKTTLIKLICGFYDPTEGRVLLNDVDIRSYNRRDYYRMFCAVFQQFGFLAGSVALNVAQSSDRINMEKVKKCVEQAGLKEKIESLPNQYDELLERTIYPEATILSGGETQRLMLARALYKDAPIVVLDEPTAALDPLAEQDIYQKYNEMTKGRSSIYISHRLASTRFCSRIIMLEDGKIIEEGTHEQLLSLNQRYAELFEIQSKYYREGAETDEEI